MARGPGKGNTNNANGRPKGVPNRTTKQAKELLQEILFGQLDNVRSAFDKLSEDPAKYIDAYSKMFGYVMPKKTDITSDDEPIRQNLNIVVDKSETAKILEDIRNASKADKRF